MSPDHAWFRTASTAIKDGVSPVLLKSNKFGLQRNNQSLIAPTFAESVSFAVHCVTTPGLGQVTQFVSVYGAMYGAGVRVLACLSGQAGALNPNVRTPRKDPG